MEDNQQDEEIRQFSCSIDNLKPIVDIVNCLSFYSSKDQGCYIEATPTELILVVTGKSKATQARITLQEGLFDEFLCTTDSVCFVVNLNVFLDCLHLFGSSSDNISATMSYTTEDEVFRLSLEEMGVITNCDISSLYMDTSDDLHHSLFTEFRRSGEVCQIIVKSEPLRGAIAELTNCFWAGSVRFDITKGSDHPGDSSGGMKLSTGGETGVSEITIPCSSDAFVSFRCEPPPPDPAYTAGRREGGVAAPMPPTVSSSYPLRSLLIGMKALAVATETFIRVNLEGMMCIQHQIAANRTGAGGGGTDINNEAYFDFLMVSEATFDEGVTPPQSQQG